MNSPLEYAAQRTSMPVQMSGLAIHTRRGDAKTESPTEKPVILPATDQQAPGLHAWADARFAVEIMAEHAFFFALLMPPELAAAERAEAERFHKTFKALFERIDASAPPESSGVRAFAAGVLEEIKPFIEYKARLGEAQAAGALRSLVWPCSSITPGMRPNAGRAGWNNWREANRNLTGKK